MNAETREKIRVALERIARQKTTPELEVIGFEGGDFEGAYDQIITEIRAALALLSAEPDGEANQPAASSGTSEPDNAPPAPDALGERAQPEGLQAHIDAWKPYADAIRRAATVPDGEK